MTACDKIAVSMAPAKTARYSDSQLAKNAQAQFWTTLHQGHYEQIPSITRLLTAAYLEDSFDPKLAGFIGFSHIWKLAERQRENYLDPTIVDQIILAKKYFGDSYQLNPNDARILGFYAASYLIEGKIFQDKREQTKGYFMLKKAIAAWPQFNYFTAGYVLSDLPSDDKLFKQALNWQWDNLDICIHGHLNRTNPDYSPYMRLETKTGRDRVCWNSWIAPFNFEGFFLNMGDMLVKSGDWQTAIKIYNNAKLARNYSQWPYRSVLEDRIHHARENVILFNKMMPLIQRPPVPTIMLHSRFSCMACHQQG